MAPNLKIVFFYDLVPGEIIELLERDGKLPVDYWKSESTFLLSDPMKCGKCDCLFSEIGNLKSHLRSHSNGFASEWVPPVYSDYFKQGKTSSNETSSNNASENKTSANNTSINVRSGRNNTSSNKSSARNTFAKNTSAWNISAGNTSNGGNTSSRKSLHSKWVPPVYSDYFKRGNTCADKNSGSKTSAVLTNANKTPVNNCRSKYLRERVRTTKIRTSKFKKNIEKFVNHHYI